MAKAHIVEDLPAHAETRDILPLLFSVRIAELWSWAEHLPHPERVRELHDMRIAAKRLRYCFEFFLPCFAPDFKDSLKQFKQLQDFLGEIHDSDVWIDYLRVQLRDAFGELTVARKDLDQYVGGADFNLRLATQSLKLELAHGPAHGLLLMIDEITARRQGLYADLLQFWVDLEGKGFRAALTQAVAAAASHPAPAKPVEVHDGG